MFLIKIVQIFFSGILNVIYEALFAAAFIMIIMKNAVQYIENRNRGIKRISRYEFFQSLSA